VIELRQGAASWSGAVSRLIVSADRLAGDLRCVWASAVDGGTMKEGDVRRDVARGVEGPAEASRVSGGRHP
jgi:hypothetical protein